MWGAMVFRAGVGPPPCPVVNLTTEILEANLKLLTSEEIKKRAQTLSYQMGLEDGVLCGLDHFISDLPKESMLCDVW
jgi:hypothetical protein